MALQFCPFIRQTTINVADILFQILNCLSAGLNVCLSGRNLSSAELKADWALEVGIAILPDGFIF